MPDQCNQLQVRQPDVLRRRLAKGGLVAPVVLASLISKPVLGQSTPWNCTISGQLSGNVSGHGEVPCGDVGVGGVTISGSYPLSIPPTPKTYRYISDATIESENITGVFPGVTTHYVFMDGAALTTTATLTTRPASINEILNVVTSDALITKLRRVLVLMINAKEHPPGYPLTVSQAERLYVAVATSGVFIDENPHVEWDQNKITYFVNLLYHD